MLNCLELNDFNMTEEEVIAMKRDIESDPLNDRCEPTESIDGNKEHEESEPNKEINVGNGHVSTRER